MLLRDATWYFTIMVQRGCIRHSTHHASAGRHTPVGLRHQHTWAQNEATAHLLPQQPQPAHPAHKTAGQDDRTIPSLLAAPYPVERPQQKAERKSKSETAACRAPAAASAPAAARRPPPRPRAGRPAPLQTGSPSPSQVLSRPAPAAPGRPRPRSW